MIYLIVILVLNIVLTYMYRHNKTFPVFFMLFGIMYCIHLYSVYIYNELFITIILCLIVFYNFMFMQEQKRGY